MKKPIFLLTVLSMIFGTCAFAQTDICFRAVARVNTEGVYLARQLAEKVVNCQKPSVIKIEQQKLGSDVVTTSVIFDHNLKKFRVDFQNDMNQAGSLMHESFIKIIVHPQGQPENEIYFADYLLNGTWDEHQSHLSWLSFRDVYGGEDEEIQKKFMGILQEALSFFK